MRRLLLVSVLALVGCDEGSVSVYCGTKHAPASVYINPSSDENVTRAKRLLAECENP